MNQIIIGIIILIVLLAVFLSGRRQRLEKVESEASDQRAEKESWAKESVMSDRQVEQLRMDLIKSIEERFADRPEDQERLKEIINDWADLKVQMFHERRSWVRRPEEEPEPEPE
ncbi:MAG: hypothetical protein JSU61_14045 [Fidelibacterota bacterium]|nr:MAG: hypothetical protein JSU61_14045 [Candidatus Neomarinimicrobiota bacterium]